MALTELGAKLAVQGTVAMEAAFDAMVASEASRWRAVLAGMSLD